jgi:hypothetical protein
MMSENAGGTSDEPWEKKLGNPLSWLMSMRRGI